MSVVTKNLFILEEVAPLLITMEEMIHYFEKQSDLLDRFDNSVIISTLATKYISCITFNGIPILPPVMTAKKRDEMQTLKRQAQISEKRVKRRQRATLMARAQSIVDTTENPQEQTFVDTKESRESHLLMSRQSGEISTEPLSATADPFSATNPGSTFAMLDSGEHGEHGEDAIGQTLDSLSSDFVSLEETPLPTVFNGIPLTSVQQQHISQTLARLSKALKLEDTQSLNSTGNSELGEMLSLKLSQGHPVPQLVSAGEPVPSIHRPINSENNSSVFHESQDTIIEVSQVVTGNTTSGFVDNNSSDKPNTHPSQDIILQTSHNDSSSLGVNSSFNSANTSGNTTDSHFSSKSSPKSLKNTVHFSHYVTEITRESVEDSVTQRKIDFTPTNSPRITVSDSELHASKGNQDYACGSKTSSPVIKAGSLLSRVDFSPECDSTPSPDQAPTMPFQAYFTDAEPSTSDKENDQNHASLIPNYHIPSMSLESVSGESRSSSQLTHSKIVSDSQGSAISSTLLSVGSSKTALKTSESESSTLKEEHGLSKECDHLLQLTGQPGYFPSDTGSTNLKMYMQTLISSQDSVSQSCSSSKDHCAGDYMGSNINDINVSLSKRHHPLRESYTLSEPSPALLRSQCRTDKDPSAIEKKSNTSVGAVKYVQHKVDYQDEDSDMELMSIPLPPGPEHDGKAEHINKYLSHIHQQNLKTADKMSTTNSKTRPQSQITTQPMSPAGSISVIQSLLQNMESLPDTLTEEEVLKIQASHFQILQQQVISQQQKELEELFIRQRREQLSLEGEVKQHQKSLQEQQEFLAENAPENLKKNKLSKTVFDGEQVSAIAENKNNFIVSSKNSSTKLNLFEKTGTPSPKGPKVYRPVLRSPMKAQPLKRRSGTVVTPEKAYHPQMWHKFERISALAKGFLTRRLLQTDKVQELIKTIKDTREFAYNFTAETPIKKGTFSNQDKDLLERITAQLQAARLDIHEIFFYLSPVEKMSLISSTRITREHKRLKISQGGLPESHCRVSTATLKAIERKKKAQEAETMLFGSATLRPRTAPPSTSSPRGQSMDIRALRPIQGQISPITAEGSSRSRVEPDRPKSAPEKSGLIYHTKLKKPDSTRPVSTTNLSGKQSKAAGAGATSTKIKVAPVTKYKSKTGKAWR